MRVISYGGGVQSTALLVLAIQGRLGDVDAALFANVGDDAEHPATLAYVRDVAEPWAILRGLPIYELRRYRKDGSVNSLFQTMAKAGSKSIPIPIRNAHEGNPMGRRTCTADWKIQVLGKWLKQNGATPKDPAEILIGFSWDEAHRVGAPRNRPNERLSYPLLDLRLDRAACLRIIEQAGLPMPPKSSCYFCPFHKPSVWAKMRRDEPALFYKSAELEMLINQRRGTKPFVYLTQFGKPLVDAIGEEMQTEFDFGRGPGAESCDDGYCWT